MHWASIVPSAMRSENALQEIVAVSHEKWPMKHNQVFSRWLYGLGAEAEWEKHRSFPGEPRGPGALTASWRQRADCRERYLRAQGWGRVLSPSRRFSRCIFTIVLQNKYFPFLYFTSGETEPEKVTELLSLPHPIGGVRARPAACLRGCALDRAPRRRT